MTLKKKPRRPAPKEKPIPAAHARELDALIVRLTKAQKRAPRGKPKA
jgi:hypothetical protein